MDRRLEMHNTGFIKTHTSCVIALCPRVDFTAIQQVARLIFIVASEKLIFVLCGICW